MSVAPQVRASTHSFSTAARAVALALIISIGYSSTAFAATTITPDTLPNPTVGIPYNQVLTASTTDVAPFTWEVSAGSLPPGLSLVSTADTVATISGTPTASGPASFNIDVHGAAASTTSQSYAITTHGSDSLGTTATLNIVTSLIRDDGGPNTPIENFSIFITGTGVNPATVSPIANATTSVSVDAGTHYSVSIPTQTYSVSLSPDCSSSIAAGESATCVIVLDDIATPPSGQAPPNLIINPQLESPDGGEPTVPYQWFKGLNPANVTYTYPATTTALSDIASGFGAQIVVTQSLGTSSDAKWYFRPAPVIPGQSYAFSDSYVATTGTNYVAAFCTDIFLTTCSYSTQIAATSTPANTWKQGGGTFTVPAGMTYMTVFHSIQNAGTLMVDNYSLTQVPPPSPFTNGFVSLTFDDGFATHFTNALPALAAAAVKGTFYVITHVIPGLSIPNPSLENASAGLPVGWSHSGSVSATYNYLSSGAHTGSHAAEVVATTTGSNAAWYFTPITVLSDDIYTYTGWYRSTTTSSLVGQVALKDGTLQNATVMDGSGPSATELGSSVSLPSTKGVWTPVQAYFYVPENGKTLTVLNRLTGSGSLAVDDVTLGVDGYMNQDQVAGLQAAGEEIGTHTQTHPDLATLSNADATAEIAGSLQDFSTGGIANITNIAYPYGSNNQSVQDIAHGSNLVSGRTVVPGWNGKNAPPYALLSQSVNADTSLATVESWIAEAKIDHTWLILTFHEIATDLTGSPYGTTPSTLNSILSYLNSGAGLPVKTVSEGMVLMGAANASAPSISSETLGSATASSLTVSWTTDHPATSRVIYDTISHSTASTTIAGPANYGYSHSTVEDVALTTNHSVTLSGLASSTSYYLRAVSHGSPETVGAEIIATTANATSTTSTTTPDTTPPTIALNGSNPMVMTIDSPFSDPGATVTDNVDVLRTITGSGTVHATVVGTYTLTYDATDIAGNHAASITRTVSIVPKSSGGGGGSSSRGSSGGGSVLGASITSSNPGFSFQRTLSYGMNGEDVRALQNILIAQGYLHLSPSTSYFGQMTRNAVLAFQTAHGLPVVGIVGPLTRNQLNQTVVASPAGNQDLFAKIAELQSKLAVLLAQLGTKK